MNPLVQMILQMILSRKGKAQQPPQQGSASPTQFSGQQQFQRQPSIYDQGAMNRALTMSDYDGRFI